ncbi:MAG TPA: hypothetical protein VEK79_19885 [Thermoanaerobaculia bacterium]|nr:hypothetical protein [Thermoanaerobaculia bacterium]
MRSPDRRSLVTYGVLVAILISVKILFLILPSRFPLEDQASAFSWITILVIALLGVAGLYLEPRAGFPAMWDDTVSNAQRFGVPTLDGIAYGLVTVLGDLGHPDDVHMQFPQSIAFYMFGAIFLEILLRLFGLTLLTWFFGSIVMRGKAWNTAFWIANIVTSMYEVWPQMMGHLARATRLESPGVVIQSILSPLFIGNLVAGWLYRRYGFLTAIILRIVFYAIWHVAYGGFRPLWLSL